MKHCVFYPIGGTEACRWAASQLGQAGYSIWDHPAPEVTHLLLDAPSFQKNGQLRCGGEIASTLQMLPPGITVVGGNLKHSALESYKKIDLLQDAFYLAKNAAITADCALKVAVNASACAISQLPVLVIGWGRIGKCLAQKLWGLGNQPYVAARDPKDQAMLEALGYPAVSIQETPALLPRLRLIFNTVPAPVLDQKALDRCQNCLKIELASQPGLEGSDVIQALGLPGSHTPESSGRLIGDTIVRHLNQKLKEESP